MLVGLDAFGSPLQVAIVPQRLGRLRHAGIAGRGTQAFARLENAGLHRVPNGLCWDLGGCSMLEWWGGGDCVVRDVLFMGPLRQMRRVAGVEVAVAKGCQCRERCTHVARTDCTPYYASALTNQQLPSRKCQFRRANPARCSGGFQRAQVTDQGNDSPQQQNGCIRADSNAMA